MLRRSSRSTSVNYAKLAGEDEEDEREEEEEEEKKGKKKKRASKKKDDDDDDDGDYMEGDGGGGTSKKHGRKSNDEHGSEEEGRQEDEAVDLFAMGPALSFIAGGEEEATIYHIPRDVIGVIFSHVGVDTLLVMRHGLNSRYFKKHIDSALSRIALARWGPGADFRALEVIYACGDELLKGQSKIIFRLRDEDMKALPKRVEHKYGRYAYEQHWFKVADVLIPAAIKRHGSMEKLATYHERLRKRKENIDERRQNSGVRQLAIQTDLEAAGGLDALPSAVLHAVQSWVRLGIGPSEGQIRLWLQTTAKIRSQVASVDAWSWFKDLAGDACLSRHGSSAAAAVKLIMERDAKRSDRQSKLGAVLSSVATGQQPSINGHMASYFKDLTTTADDVAFAAELKELAKRVSVTKVNVDERKTLHKACPCGSAAATDCPNHLCFDCCVSKLRHRQCYRHGSRLW